MARIRSKAEAHRLLAERAACAPRIGRTFAEPSRCAARRRAVARHQSLASILASLFLRRI